MKNPKKLVIAIFAILVVIVLGIYLISINNNSNKTSEVETTVQNEQGLITLSVVNGQESRDYDLEYKDEEKLIDLLKRLASEDNNFTFATQEFSFGSFVTKLNETEADSTKEFWSIQVNGVDAAVGIGDLVVTKEDNFKFVLTQFE